MTRLIELTGGYFNVLIEKIYIFIGLFFIKLFTKLQ